MSNELKEEEEATAGNLGAPRNEMTVVPTVSSTKVDKGGVNGGGNNPLPNGTGAVLSNGHHQENGAKSIPEVLFSADRAAKTDGNNDEEDDIDDDDDIDGEKNVSNVPLDDEENLFNTLEHEQEEMILASQLYQPKAVASAPRLLQAALKEGQVKADDSEEESDQEKQAMESGGEAAAAASPEKVASLSDHHIHKRVRTRTCVWTNVLAIRLWEPSHFQRTV